MALRNFTAYLAIAMLIASTLVVAKCGGRSKNDRDWDRFIDFIKKEKWNR